MKVITKHADELDMVEHRRHFNWHRGETKSIKARMNRRGRRAARQDLHRGIY